MTSNVIHAFLITPYDSTWRAHITND